MSKKIDTVARIETTINDLGEGAFYDADDMIDLLADAVEAINSQHTWVGSTLGHGDLMCKKCRVTVREATVIGNLNDCPVT